MIRVLVVGQTPPPVHGQAVMIEQLLRARFTRVKLYHVRMAFSDSVGEVGRFRLHKLWHLFSVIVRIVYCRVVHRTRILYYPPAGPNRVPVYRDIAILLSTRWMFQRTVFHFHATGVSQLYPRLSRTTKFFFRGALFKPDAIIRIARGGPNDGELLQTRREFIIPNGIDDAFPAATAANSAKPAMPAATPLRILFVGMLRESKGLLVLLDACRFLAQRHIPFHVEAAGQFESDAFAQQVHERIDHLRLNKQVEFLGVITGDLKWEAFARADLLCLPTHFPCETFPTVLLEAMSFQLPVVATRWRGIPEIVDDGIHGFLVEPRDSAALADCLIRLQADPVLRLRMGQLGRDKFLREFTLQSHLRQMEQALVDVAEGAVMITAASGAAPIATTRTTRSSGEVVC